jgi:hypothetical protein
MASMIAIPPNDDSLAALARRLLGDPLQESVELKVSDLSPNELDTLRALAADLRTDETTLLETSEGRTKLLAQINLLLSVPSLTGNRAKEAASRLNARGGLSPSKYQIVFTDGYSEFEELGVSRKQAEEIIRQPDALQHVLPDQAASSDFPLISLFAKRFKPDQGQAYVILVVARRLEADVYIHAAWRVPEHILLRTPDTDLIALLKEFVQVFGLLITIPQRAPTKFIYYDAVQIDPRQPLLQQLKVTGPKGAVARTSYILRVSDLGVLQVACAYAIDMGAYRASLASLTH